VLLPARYAISPVDGLPPLPIQSEIPTFYEHLSDDPAA
jgi:hypothetical protein